ncbi:hypothetical protein [Chitinophaga rhizophila]|uniref:Uncharacterized protein n=1 Tax=Chitinophaga rhizophila TaxID=2866212 RepID=A0ABS7GJZ1_9BACT|nr:hypothetical protein [Chitinophaga rhizophila]MBW8686972.1 hypothetical protein [Chitinophaga rhizophila]
MPYEFYEEFTHPIIFIKDHKIALYENWEGSVEGIVNNQIFVKSGAGNSISGTFTPQSAIFDGWSIGPKGSKYYILRMRNDDK